MNTELKHCGKHAICDGCPIAEKQIMIVNLIEVGYYDMKRTNELIRRSTCKEKFEKVVKEKVETDRFGLRLEFVWIYSKLFSMD